MLNKLRCARGALLTSFDCKLLLVGELEHPMNVEGNSAERDTHNYLLFI